ncbi:MAG: hypothetical protein ABIP46_02155, partial [Polaromonas sp.]
MAAGALAATFAGGVFLVATGTGAALEAFTTLAAGLAAVPFFSWLVFTTGLAAAGLTAALLFALAAFA